MRKFLLILFSLIFVCMSVVTVRALLERSVFDNGALMRDLWFQATLCDAYFGFITFGVWVCYRESLVWKKFVWMTGILLFGNFAMSAYVLWNLFHLPADAEFSQLLLKPDSTPAGVNS